MTGRKAVVWAGQGTLIVVLVLFVGRAVVRNWDAFPRDAALHVRPGWLLLSAATIFVTYALLIAAWRGVLMGWGQALGYAPAARVWCLSNLGRYLPGKIWSVAGLALLSQRAGVSGGAAAAAAIVMQALALGTGAAVVAVTAPGTASPVGLAIAIALAVCLVGLLIWKRATNWVATLARPAITITPLRPSAAVMAAGATALSWVAYGLAFWFLAKGMLGAGLPSPQTAIGVFAAGYIVGLLALFAPGGVGVRELVYVALLGPIVGSTSAVALSVASRLLLTMTEAGAALAAVAAAK